MVSSIESGYDVETMRLWDPVMRELLRVAEGQLSFVSTLTTVMDLRCVHRKD